MDFDCLVYIHVYCTHALTIESSVFFLSEDIISMPSDNSLPVVVIVMKIKWMYTVEIFNGASYERTVSA